MRIRRPITNEEYKRLESRMDLLSDMDYGYNPETDQYDVPSIEWDGPFGRHWQRFESEEARDRVLREYEIEFEVMLNEVRNEIRLENIEKGRMKKELKVMKTLGGQFPILKELLELSRESYN